MFSVIHPYYNHTTTLPLHIELWNKLPRETQIVVVDDHSPVPIDLKRIRNEVQCHIKVVWVEDDVVWNDLGARNIGAAVADGDRLIMSDFDCAVTPELMKYLVKYNQPLDTIAWPCIQFNPNAKYGEHGKIGKFHCNSFVIWKEFFNKIGGYDEDFSGGWGYGDTYFTDCLAPYAGAKKEFLKPPAYFRYFREHNFGEYTVGRPGEQRNAKMQKEKIRNKEFEKGPGKTLRCRYKVLFEK